MNKNIENLYHIAAKDERRIIGLMSGTSLDGLDIALCTVRGSGASTEISIDAFETVAYKPAFKNELKEICFQQKISLQKLALLNKHIAVLHAAMINRFLTARNLSASAIDLIASHGQTIYHAPLSLHHDAVYGNATLQIGDGDHIALLTGITTVSDFRQKNIAGGGEGAPLAVYGDVILFAEPGNDVVLLNIGGISNFTFIPVAGSIVCSDLGPGNTLMNRWMQLNFPGCDQDEDAAIARQGTVNNDLLQTFKSHSFFAEDFPKTTGPELFGSDFISNALFDSGLDNLSAADVMATLNKLTGDIISEGIKKMMKNDKAKIFISGGGIHNPVLMEHLKKGLPLFEIHSTEEKGIDPDAKEAVLFALLANECISGDALFFAGSQRIPAVSMGKISFPH